MTINILERVESIYPDRPITLALDSSRGRVTEIIILREPAHVHRTAAPAERPLSLVPDDFDDDLANATWEDAEWR
jgi:hypothetical protein